MKNITPLATSTIKQSKISVLVEFYNEYATELGINTIKKFRDKDTAIARVQKIQEEYVAEFKKQNQIKSKKKRKLQVVNQIWT